LHATSHGLLLMDRKVVSLIDLSTGKPKGGNNLPAKNLKGATSLVVKQNQAIVCGRHSLYAISLVDGSYETIVEQIGFDGDEQPQVLELRTNGYFLRSRRNIALFDFDGKREYHVILNVPEMGWLKKALMKGLEKGLEKGLDYLDQRMTNSIDAASDDLGSDYKSGSQDVKEDLSELFQPSVIDRYLQTDNYIFVFAIIEDADEESPAFLKIDKDTGEIRKQVVLREKEPEYILDEENGRLFVKTDESEVICYDF